MTQFEIWDYNFPMKGLHHVVLLSHPDRCARADYINVLFCTSQRQSRARKPYEVMLDSADGLNWETFCDCSIMWVIERAALHHKRGTVTFERRAAIRAMVRETFRLSAQD